MEYKAQNEPQYYSTRWHCNIDNVLSGFRGKCVANAHATEVQGSRRGIASKRECNREEGDANATLTMDTYPLWKTWSCTHAPQCYSTCSRRIDTTQHACMNFLPHAQWASIARVASTPSPSLLYSRFERVPRFEPGVPCSRRFARHFDVFVRVFRNTFSRNVFCHLS